MSNGNGPQEQAEPGQPAAEPDEQTKKPDEGAFKSQPSITVICPSCRQPATQSGNEIYCESCDVTFVITKKKGAQVKQIGPIEELQGRVTMIEGTIGITGDSSGTPAEKEAAARKEGAAEVALEVAAEIESAPVVASPAGPAEPARPASQDGGHTNQDEILGPRGDGTDE